MHQSQANSKTVMIFGHDPDTASRHCVVQLILANNAPPWNFTLHT